jgi:hypothetical protein
MMGNGAFVLLKAGSRGPKTAKQVEIRLAVLLKILEIAGLGHETRPQRRRTGVKRDLMQISAGYA